MSHWLTFARLADRFREKRLQIILANPFSFSQSTYPKVLAELEKQKLTNRANLAFLRSATHPKVSRHEPEIVPGWNSSNAEINHLDHDGCYFLFGRQGDLLFFGRTTDADISARVEKALN